jgi:hypothetical protein
MEEAEEEDRLMRKVYRDMSEIFPAEFFPELDKATGNRRSLTGQSDRGDTSPGAGGFPGFFERRKSFGEQSKPRSNGVGRQMIRLNSNSTAPNRNGDTSTKDAQIRRSNTETSDDTVTKDPNIIREISRDMSMSQDDIKRRSTESDNPRGQFSVGWDHMISSRQTRGYDPTSPLRIQAERRASALRWATVVDHSKRKSSMVDAADVGQTKTSCCQLICGPVLMHDGPLWLNIWACVMLLLLIYEVFVFLYVDIFTDERMTAGAALLMSRIMPHFFTGVYAVDLLGLSWRILPHTREQLTGGELLQRYFQSPWSFLDVVGALPWDLMPYPWRPLRLLRVARARVVLPLISSGWRRIFPTSAGYGLTLAIVPIIISSMMHVTACIMGALAHEHHGRGDDSMPSWVDSLKPLGVQELPGSVFRDVGPWSVYLWALYFSCTTFTTIGYGDITVQNDTEAAVAIVLMLVSAACFAQCLAVFSTLVAEQFNALRLRNIRARSLKKYSKWRGTSDDTTSMLAKFVRDRTPERNPELQLVLPENPLPPHFAEYEKKVFNALNPLVRKEMRMKLFSHSVEHSQVLAWLAPSKRAVRETVEAAKFEVFGPGTLLFEANDRIKHVLLVMAGQVSIEHDHQFDQEPTETTQSAVDRARSTIGSEHQVEAAVITAEAIQEILDFSASEDSESEDEEEDPVSPTPAKSDGTEAGDATGNGQDAPVNGSSTDQQDAKGTSVTIDEDVDDGDSVKKKRSKERASKESIGTSWQFAIKVLEKIDSQMDIGFDDDEDEQHMETNLPVENAPCVFGENSMWFSEMTNGFSGRSVSYTELLRIPTSTLIQIAKSDPRIKCRFDAFREAVQQYAVSKNAQKIGW